jgi:hypothetical protein
MFGFLDSNIHQLPTGSYWLLMNIAVTLSTLQNKDW